MKDRATQLLIKYKSGALVTQCAKKTLAALVAIAAENSLLFMAYGATQRVVSRLAKLENDELGVLGHGLAGGGQALL